MKMSSDMKTWKYARLFLDTNALLKLLVPELKEPGTETLRGYLETGIQLHTCNYCIGEVMGILKRKWLSNKEQPNLTTDGYLMAINRLKWKIDNKELVLHELSLPSIFDEPIQLVKKYKIDCIDALLLNHIFHSEELDLFVTADADLSNAARELGVLCWNILEYATPPE
jgi:predicted nucleic acid-binding protein